MQKIKKQRLLSHNSVEGDVSVDKKTFLSILFIFLAVWLCAAVSAQIAAPRTLIVLDSDKDGIADTSDNCKYEPNRDQLDRDQDGVGDACDNCISVLNPDQESHDDDHIGSACDNCPDKYNEDQADSDMDGVGDACELNTELISNLRVITPLVQLNGTEPEEEEEYAYEPPAVSTEPVSLPKDTDGDGFFDITDNCKYDANPGQADADKDGVGDDCDTCRYIKNPDQKDDWDNDKYGDGCDTCPDIYDPDQKDTDNDKIGDACDNCPKVSNPDQLSKPYTSDWDDDGIGNECDNCPDNYNPDQNDTDSEIKCEIIMNKKICTPKLKPDGYGDACDTCSKMYNPDQYDCPNADNDHYCDFCDNCPTVSNWNQKDSDLDGKGDACDKCPFDSEDSDGDGIEDKCDLCPSDYANQCSLCTAPINQFPSFFDWRYMGGKNWMTPVRDQGSCGSCYAHSPVGAIEAKYNIEQKAFKNISLSEQMFVSNCFAGVGSCFGGWHTEVMKHVKADGMVTESKYPYQSADCVYDVADPQPNDPDHKKLACINGCTPDYDSTRCSFPKNCDASALLGNSQVWRISKYFQISNTINDVKRGLVCKGPLSVCSPNWWHCVVLVGWDGDNWIVKNSWGTGWQYGGYGYVPMTGHPYSEIINDAWYVEGVSSQ
jgi:C1A family cysteine protease